MGHLKWLQIDECVIIRYGALLYSMHARIPPEKHLLPHDIVIIFLVLGMVFVGYFCGQNCCKLDFWYFKHLIRLCVYHICIQ